MSKLWIYGIHSCIEALKNKKRIIYEARCANSDITAMIKSIRPDLKVCVVSQANIGNVSNSSNHQGIAIYCESLEIHKKLSTELVNQHTHILILDQIQDVSNLGAIMRSMVANNFTALVVTRKNMPTIEKYAIKSSCGAIEHLSIFQIANLTEGIKLLKKNDFYCVALDHRGKIIKTAEEYKDSKIAGVIGSEGGGIRNSVLQVCDIKVSLATNPKFPVLNASVAAGIFMYIISHNT